MTIFKIPYYTCVIIGTCGLAMATVDNSKDEMVKCLYISAGYIATMNITDYVVEKCSNSANGFKKYLSKFCSFTSSTSLIIYLHTSSNMFNNVSKMTGMHICILCRICC